MIQSKDDLKKYLEADKFSLGRKEKKPAKRDYIWRYEILLRKTEYYFNRKVKMGGYIINSFISSIIEILIDLPSFADLAYH